MGVIEKHMVKYTENLCVGGTPISSQDFTTYSASRAFDGNPNSDRRSAETGEGVNGVSWIGYKFNEPKRVEKIYFHQHSGGSAVESIKIQASNDEENWETILVTDVNPSDQYIEFTNEKKYLMWRLLANSSTIDSSSRWNVYEIEMYEKIYINKYVIKKDNQVYSIMQNHEWFNIEMKSNNNPYPYVITASSEQDSYQAYKAFNSLSSSSDCWMTPNNIINGWIQIDFGESKLVNKLILKSRNSSDASTYSPRDFQVLGSNDNVNFYLLTSILGEDDWAPNEEREYKFNNLKKYRYYRLNILRNNGGIAVAIGQIIFGFDEEMLAYLDDASGVNIAKYGIDKGTDVDLNKELNKQRFISSIPEHYIEGRVFRTKINLIETPIKKMDIIQIINV